MPNMAIVSLTDFGQIYVEKQLIQTQAQFTQIVEDYLQRNPEGLVILNASEKRSYQEVMQVLDWLKAIGGTRVALGTMSGSSKSMQNDLGTFFNEELNPGVTPVNPAIPQIPTAQPSNDFQLEPLKSNESLPPPAGFELDLVPLEKFGEPPSPETLDKPQ
jgi:biopolymer transport protein ExbD